MLISSFGIVFEWSGAYMILTELSRRKRKTTQGGYGGVYCMCVCLKLKIIVFYSMCIHYAVKKEEVYAFKGSGWKISH